MFNLCSHNLINIERKSNKNKVIVKSKDFLQSMGLYKIHVLGVSKYIVFTKRI
jgi:hypothetical protein